MITKEEIGLISDLDIARGELFHLLTDDEKETKRRYGSDYPITFEDTVRALIQGGRDPRQLDLTLALNSFTRALNAVLEYVEDEEIHKTQAKTWAKKRGLRMEDGCTTIEDAIAEAFFQIRHSLARACPKNYRLFPYCWSIVFRSLDTWWGKQQAPVEIPVHVARTRTGRPSRMRLNPQYIDAQSLKEEDDE